MNKMDNTTKILKTLTDKCIDNVEQSFNLFLLGDLIDVGEVTEIFNNSDWYVYYLECAWELTTLINNLLSIEDSKDQLLQAVSLKRIIDERLMFYSGDNLDKILLDLDFRIGNSDSKLLITTEKIVDLQDFIERLYLKLIDKKLIDGSLITFKAHFLQSETQTPINWIGRLNGLASFFKYLVNRQYIDVGNEIPQALICRHFTLDGNKIKRNSTNTYYTNVDERLFNFIELCNKP